MNIINTILIDDEQDSIEQMQMLLAIYPQIKVTGTFTSPKKALQEIEMLQPDIIFLDIEMPGMNGFDFLEKIIHLNFNVVFVTAYSDFALKAFRFNAFDYIVKPVGKEELAEVIAKIGKQQSLYSSQLEQLKYQLKQGYITKIAIPGQQHITFIDIKDIAFAESSGNYSQLVLADGKKHLVTRQLREIQDVLEEQHFLRIHRQYIINLNLVRSFNRIDNIITLTTGDSMPVSRNQKDRLIESYGWL